MSAWPCLQRDASRVSPNARPAKYSIYNTLQAPLCDRLCFRHLFDIFLARFPTYFPFVTQHAGRQLILEVNVQDAEQRWIRKLQRFESQVIAAVTKARAESDLVLRLGGFSVSAAKNLITARVRWNLPIHGVPVRTHDSGNIDIPYLLVPDICIIRVKGLDRSGRPSSTPTEAALAYVGGEENELFPSLPRVDLAYRVIPVSFEIEEVAFVEWAGTQVRGRYVLPFGMQPRIIEVAGELAIGPTETSIEIAASVKSRRSRRTGTGDPE